MSPHPAMTIIDLKYKLRDYVHNAIRTADLIKTHVISDIHLTRATTQQGTL